MSRPTKKGLSYFPLDTDFMRDLKIQRLLLELGCEGLSVYLALLGEIYATDGYYMPVGPVVYLNIGFMLKIREDKVKKIIAFCLQLGLFDESLHEKEQILTSYGIQERYAEISKRTANRIKPAYRIVREEETETPVSAAETPIIVTETPVSATKTSRVLNENENENENKTGKNYGKRSSTGNDDETRRAELLKMAALATGSNGHA